MLGVRQRCAKLDERRQNLSEQCRQKVLRALFDILVIRFLFDEYGLREVFSILHRGLFKGQLKSVGLVITHSKKSLALLRVWDCSFCSTAAISTFEAIGLGCYGPGAEITAQI